MANIGGVDAVTIGMSSGEATAAGGAADWRSGVPAVETKPFGRHLVEVGGADKRMPLIACVAPSVVVGHAKNDVGLFGGGRDTLGSAFSDGKRGQQGDDGAFKKGETCFC